MNNFNFSNQFVIVTGAAGSLGSTVAEQFHKAGAHLALVDISFDKLRSARLRNARNIGLFPADLTDVNSVNNVVEDIAKVFGQIDVLANVAGYVAHGTILDCDDEQWEFSFNLNARSMHHMMQSFLPGMLSRAKRSGKSGSIINMSSGASSIKGVPDRYVYSATKAAINTLSRG